MADMHTDGLAREADRRMEEEVYSQRRILITGGLGFIGSTLARRLVSARARVTVADSLVPEYGGNLFNIAGLENKLQVNISDVRDEHSMRYLVQGQDFLFNLAGQTSHADSMQNPYADLQINCQAQLAQIGDRIQQNAVRALPEVER